jgi:hypothetical protein
VLSIPYHLGIFVRHAPNRASNPLQFDAAAKAQSIPDNTNVIGVLIYNEGTMKLQQTEWVSAIPCFANNPYPRFYPK